MIQNTKNADGKNSCPFWFIYLHTRAQKHIKHELYGS